MASPHSNHQSGNGTGVPASRGGGAPSPGGTGMPNEDEVRELVSRLNRGGEFVMTSRHETSRLGVVVRRVMCCADAPMSVCVALMKGHPISPLIRDSHSFALCALGEGERVLARMFDRTALGGVGGTVNGQATGVLAPSRMGDAASDPFISMEVESIATGSPVIKRCAWALDCRVLMHLDFETDHEMYIGMVVGGRGEAVAKPQSGKASKRR